MKNRKGRRTLLLLAAALAAPLAAQAFVHPGVLNNRFELEYMKAQVAMGAQPWKGAYDKMKSMSEASLTYRAAPHANVGCGSASNPDYGCSDEKRDSQAAYLHALLWAVGGDEAHAQKAAEILNAWSAVLRVHSLSNADLEAGWTGGPFVRAAEILRYTYAKWDKASIDQFKVMLDAAYLPLIKDGQQASTNGNWDAVMIESLISIAVFEDDQTLFDKAVFLYKRRLPAYIYATSDGPMPITVDSTVFNTKAKIISHWYNQSTFMDGLCQETCRDLTHTQWGIGGLIDVAEIAWKQGVDLYSERDNRLMTGMEFHAPFVGGAKGPANLCGGHLSNGGYVPMWEIGYDHYHDWMKLPMPNSEALIKKNRPDTYDHHLSFGTLTHAGMGGSGETWQGTISILDPKGKRDLMGTRTGLRIFDLRGREISALSSSVESPRALIRY